MNPPPLPVADVVSPIQGFFRRIATSLKLFAIFILAGFLQLPLWMINGLMRERLERRDAAVGEITSTWGRAQTLIGPILVVPYVTSYSAEKITMINGREVRTAEDKTRIA